MARINWKALRRLFFYLNRMSQDSKKIKSFHEKVNLLERLHKTCQLSSLGLQEPILNETRYLARALADVLYFLEDQEKLTQHLATAELAVHSAINDAVDVLVTHTKDCLSDLITNYPHFHINNSSYAAEHLQALKAMLAIDEIVVYSRGKRTERYNTYKQLAFGDAAANLEVISGFALKLPLIETIAQNSTRDPNAPPEDSASDLFIATGLNAALNNNSDSGPKLCINLQPKYRLKNEFKELIGAEALVRFNYNGTPIQPTHFIPVAERNQLISAIDRFVLESALDVLSNNSKLPYISVNVSALELLSPNYADEVKALIQSKNISPERIELELTEGMVITDKASNHHLHELSQLGVRIAIDDFGTGETKFDYLATLPVNAIKIDISLVRKYQTSPNSYKKLLSAINAIGVACETEVIAEGVDSQQIIDALVDIGISDFQGYHFGRPVSISEFIAEHLS